MNISLLREKLENFKCRSAWDRGVNAYALELLEDLEESVERGYKDAEDLDSVKILKKSLLNGADSWSEFSWGGYSLIYNEDIAERLCSPSELKRTNFGKRRPNSREDWLDTQARALFQACNRICHLAKECI